jgi:capsular exopolysaccharide synthesis family protein
MLRTQVLQRMNAHQWNALAITSPGSGQGKTLTAINLAISLAREVRHTVLLADFDLRNPSIHKYFDFAPRYGINDYLVYDTPLPEILLNPGIERLVILPGRESLFNSSEMLASPKMTQLVTELKDRYPSRFVLFDLPPLLSADDALAFAPFVDSVLLILEEGKTKRDDVQRAVGLLHHTNIIGTVLNKSEEAIDSYY